ncbi:MAG: hypothetical protein JSR64_05825 [Nitrospira sp.]|nr:hypothetical protein [Nitrospira sp.]
MRFSFSSLVRKIAEPIIQQVAGVAGRQFASSLRQIESMMILQGRSLSLQNVDRAPLACLQDAEFKVFSQYGEDGILQYLVRETGIERKEQVFVEFGVQDYWESNTRFLLQGDHWRGLIIDGSKEYMDSVRRSDLYWRNDLTAVAAWIDRDNINDLIGDAGFIGDIGILSVDIDGNDYWVWEKIDVVNPVIVVVEWNSVFGAKHAISIPYAREFDRATAHYSCLYWGASMRAFEDLGARKGYALVGSNRLGNNIFFVRHDRLGRLKALTTDEAYVVSRFRDSRDAQGNLNFLGDDRRYEEIKNLPVVDVVSGRTTTLHDLDAVGIGEGS